MASSRLRPFRAAGQAQPGNTTPPCNGCRWQRPSFPARRPGADRHPRADLYHLLPARATQVSRPKVGRSETVGLGIDVETCPRCGGKMKIIALVRDPQSIARYLRHLGLPTSRSPCRPSPSDQTARHPSADRPASALRRKTGPETAGFSSEFGSPQPSWDTFLAFGHQATTTPNTPGERS
jgi:hypothetical protein